MGWTPPSAPTCPACERRVYPAEMVMAVDRTPFHKQCVKCKHCKKSLTAGNINAHQLQLYCKVCYEQLFNSQEHCTGTYGGIVTPEDLERKAAEEAKQRALAERRKLERRCPTCDRRAYPDDSIQIGDGVFFHKVCLRCSECNKGPDDQTPMMLGPKSEKKEESAFEEKEELQPYCKFCFAKKFKISILNIKETVCTMPEPCGVSL